MRPRVQILAALAAGTLLGLVVAGLPRVQARPARTSSADAALTTKVARLEGQVDFLAVHVAALETRLRPADGRPRPLYEHRPFVLVPGPHTTPGSPARRLPRPSAP